jgi:hypothetical protein
MKITGHKTSSMFKRYADLLSNEEQGSTARSSEPPARVEEGASRERSHDANTYGRSIEPAHHPHI